MFLKKKVSVTCPCRENFHSKGCEIHRWEFFIKHLEIYVVNIDRWQQKRARHVAYMATRDLGAPKGGEEVLVFPFAVEETEA